MHRIQLYFIFLFIICGAELPKNGTSNIEAPKNASKIIDIKKENISDTIQKSTIKLENNTDVQNKNGSLKESAKKPPSSKETGKTEDKKSKEKSPDLQVAKPPPSDKKEESLNHTEAFAKPKTEGDNKDEKKEEPDQKLEEGKEDKENIDYIEDGMSQVTEKVDTEEAKSKEEKKNKLPENKETKEKVQEPVAEKKVVEAEEDDSTTHVMTFFIVIAVLIAGCYLCMHNKKKILGLILEGKNPKTRRNVRYRRLSTNDDEHESGTVIY